MKPISQETQNNILSLLNSNSLSYRQIALRTGTGKSTVEKIARTMSCNRQNCPSGRPSKLSETDRHTAVHLIESGKADNAVQVAQTLSHTLGDKVSPETVCRVLRASNLKAVVKKKRPRLSTQHQKARLDFAIKYQGWTVDNWKKVIWSDETKINCVGSDGQQYVWKRVGEKLNDRQIQGTVKFGGGSVMVWGCMTWDGVGTMTKVEGRMTSKAYTSILEHSLFQTVAHYGYSKEGIVFQQDNDPKHTSKEARSWFNSHHIILLDWPAQSPDLNPIEHLWAYLKRRLAEYESPPRGVHELWERLEREWPTISVEVCRTLLESMPRRIEAVIKAKGGHTKY